MRRISLDTGSQNRMLQQQVSQEIGIKYFYYFFFHFFSAKLIFLFLPLVTLVSFCFLKNVFSIVEILNKLNKNDNKSNFMDNSYDNDN